MNSRCPHCDSRVAAGALICPACGRPVPATASRSCADCGKAAESTARFCGQCGAPLLGTGDSGTWQSLLADVQASADAEGHPEEIGEYVALAASAGVVAAASEFPLVDAHLQAGCAVCWEEKQHIEDYLKEDEPRIARTISFYQYRQGGESITPGHAATRSEGPPADEETWALKEFVVPLLLRFGPEAIEESEVAERVERIVNSYLEIAREDGWEMTVAPTYASLTAAGLVRQRHESLPPYGNRLVLDSVKLSLRRPAKTEM